MRKSIFFSMVVLIVFFLSPYSQAATINDGHYVIGATQGSTTWYFAEGCTRPGFNTFLCLGNPNSQAVNVQVTLYEGNGATIKTNSSIPGNSRNTLYLNSDPVMVVETEGDKYVQNSLQYYGKRDSYFVVCQNQDCKAKNEVRFIREEGTPVRYEIIGILY